MTTPAPGARIVGLAGTGALVAGLAVLCVRLLELPLRRLPMRTVGVFNEGWNAFAAERALGEGPLYPEFASLLANNYPPLSYFLVGGLGRLVGDQIIAGRAAALASLLFVALGVHLLVRRATGSRLLGAFGALFLLATMALDFSLYVGLNDPQWLAHAFMMAGLIAFPVSGGDRRRLMLAGLLMLAGGLVKHSLVPLPLAITLWLFWHDRKSAWLWLGFCTAALAAAALLLQLAFGPDAFLGIFAAPRRVEAGLAMAKLAEWLPPLIPCLLGSLLLLALDWRNAFSRLLALYIALALVWAAFTLAGAGVSYNALFDVAIGSAIASAVAVARLEARLGAARAPLVRTAALVLLCAPLFVRAPGDLGRMRAGIASLPIQEMLTLEDSGFLAAQRGPALCERPALCYWAGKPYEVDVFNSVEKIATGTLPPGVLGDLLAQRYFGVLHVSSRQSRIYREALPWYRVVHERRGWVFMLPR